MQDRQNAADVDSIAAEAPSKEWHKPVATFIPVNSTENSPGGWPDAGVNYS